MQSSNQVKLVTVRDYAILHGLCLDTVYRHLWANRLSATKVARQWMIQVPAEAPSGRTEN